MKAIVTGDSDYPYRNISLSDLEGDIWKDIPGYVDYYQISNYGRVKSLEREIERISLRYSYTIKSDEKILKGKINKRININTNTFIYGVSHGLCVNKKKYCLRTARMVYYLFVERFDLDDKNTYISYKDWDGRNIQASNLYKTKMSDKINESYQLDRLGSPLASQMRRTVSQYDANGLLIKKFKSPTQAARFYRWEKKGGIVQAASGKTISYKGFFWRFNTAENKLDLNAIKTIKESNSNKLINTLVSKNIKRLNCQKTVLTDASINLSLENLEGEVWKNLPEEIVPGIKISNYGRVKREQYLGIHWTREKILSWSVRIKKQTKILHPPRLILNIKNLNKQVNISISRWVYRLFVDPSFDVTNKKADIGFKDDNKLNLDYRNLFLKHFKK